MSLRILGAAIVAGVTAMTPPAVNAGDLGGYPPPAEYSGRDYYVPPRHGDVVDRYDPRDDLPPPPPSGGSYKDEPLPPPPRYSQAPRGPRCISRTNVEDRLVAAGWRDFSDPEKRGELGVFKARRPNGRLFELSVDRCSGEIVDARPLERVVRGYAAYRPHWGWERRSWGRRYW